MSGNIHFTATGDASDFKKMMRDVREEIRDTEGSVDDLKGRLSDAVGDRDLFGLKEAIEEGKGELESLGKSIGKIEDIINQLPAGSSEHKGMLDVLTQMKGKYAGLESTLGHAEKAMTILRGTMIRTAASIGVVTALAAGLVIAVRAVTKECRETKRAIEAGFGAVQGQTAQWLTDFYKAQALWKSAQGDVDKLNGYLETHRDILEASGIAINDINDGDKAFIENSDAMVDAIKKRAVAMAFEQAASVAAQKAAEEYLDAEEKVAKRENRNSTNMFQQAWNVLRFGRYQNGEMSEEAQQYFAGKYDKWRGKADDKASFWVGITQKMSENGIAAMQEYEKAMEELGFKTAGGTKNEKDYKAALDDTIARMEKYAALMDRIGKLREDQARSNAKTRIDIEQQAEQARIDAMRDGLEKEQAQRELNQRRELEMIKQAKEEYIRAYRERAKAIWDAEEEARAQQDPSYGKRKFDPSGTTPDTGFFDTLYRATVEKQQNDLINPLLSQYQTYEERRKEIMARGAADVNALLSKGYKDQANIRRQETKKQLSDLKAQELAETDVWKKLLGDLSEISTDLLLTYIDTAQEMLDNTSNLTAEDIKIFTTAILNAREEVIHRNPFSALKDAYDKYRKAVEAGDEAAKKRAAKEMRQSVDASNEQMQAVVGSMADISSLFSDRLPNIINGIGSVANSAANAISAFEAFEAGEGSAGGAYAAAAAFLYTGGKFFKELSEQLNDEADRAYVERLDFLKQYQLALVRLHSEDFETLFGTKTIAATADAYKKMNEALAQYEQQYKKLGGIFGGSSSSDMFDLSRVYKFAGSSKYGGDLRDMVIRTYKSLTGFFDQYQRLSDLAPELWGGNPATGEFDVEAAKAFLETNTQITDEQRKQLELLIQQKEAYDEASKAVDNTISNLLGSLASDITDIIWDSVVNGGEDAWERFGEIGADVITKLGKQLIQEMVISEYLEQFRDQMRAAYGLGDATATQQAMRDVVQSIFGGMEAMFAAGSAVAEEWNAWAEANGFDLSGDGTTETSGRTAVAKAMTSVSQESWDVVDGKITNMMMRLLDVDDRLAVVQDVQYRMYEQVSVIAGHTARLERMDANMNAMRSDIEDIRTRGIKMQQI